MQGKIGTKPGQRLGVNASGSPHGTSCTASRAEEWDANGPGRSTSGLPWLTARVQIAMTAMTLADTVSAALWIDISALGLGRRRTRRLKP